MRRIDVIAIGIGIFLAVAVLGFRLFGLDGISAGIWSQAVMVGGVVAGWPATAASGHPQHDPQPADG
jgi:hypothetical protein